MLTRPTASYLYRIWALDKVVAYRFNSAAGTITANHPRDLATSPGAGARHITFHSNGKWAYVINELDSTVNALRDDSQTARADTDRDRFDASCWRHATR